MSEVQQLVDQLPIDQIARQAGVDEADARKALDSVVPLLVGGMQANATDPAGASSLLGALNQHQGALPAALTGDVDAADGEKIVQNVFGSETDQIARAAGGSSGMSDVIRKILPIVAPIVIAWIANKYFSGQQEAGAPTQNADSPFGGGEPQQPQADNPFGGQQAPQQTPQQVPQQAPQQADQSGGGLADVLGGLLGGGGSSSGNNPLGPLGDVLGGLLGGGRR